jgi:hypothetical protein
MNQIVEVTLGLEGLEYVRECLSIGKALSHSALDMLDLASGVLTTFLPSGVSQADILRFWSGGKVDEETVYIRRDSQTMRFGRKQATDTTFFSLIAEHVKSDSAAFCVLEDQLGSPRDPWLADLPAPKLTDGQNMYYLLHSAHTDREAMKRTFNRALSIRPPLIGFLGLGELSTIFDRGQIPPSDPGFREITASTEQILIGAYDGESFLRWRRAGHSRHSARPLPNPAWARLKNNQPKFTVPRDNDRQKMYAIVCDRPRIPRIIALVTTHSMARDA